MVCVGVNFFGKRIRKNGRYVSGNLERYWDKKIEMTRYFINGIEVRPGTVGQVPHQRFKETFKKGREKTI